MIISKKQINRFSNYMIFMVAFFLQSFGDGYYIAHGQDPTLLKAVKYGLILLGIIWGMIQLSGKRRATFQKETCNVLFAILVFLLISLLMILFRGGDLGFCLELIIRYSFSILYAYVILNLFDFDGIYKLMTYVLFVSLMGWMLEKGTSVFILSNYGKMSFSRSYSPFESHYFAAPSINCCAFFLYYRKNKLLSALSFAFVILTFKRPQILFAILFLVLPFIINPNQRITKLSHTLCCIVMIVGTILYYQLMLPENEWIIQGITGQTAELFTSGRSTVLRNLLNAGYQSRGLGSTELVVGRGIEMDLVAFMLEMSVAALAVFIFCYGSISGRKIYAIAVMGFKMLSALTGAGLYNIFGAIPLYLFFGSINYLKIEDFDRKRIVKWIRIKSQ